MILRNSFFTFITTFLLFVLLNTFDGLHAQNPHPILRSFNGAVIDQTVRLNWIITSGNTCAGIQIQRSDSNLFYQTIGKINGVCGAPDVDVSYVFVDDDPLENQTNYYRLELGTQGYSTPVLINYVPLNNQGYNLRYDIHTKVATVFFDNPDDKPVFYNLISVSGTNILSSKTNASHISLNLSAYAVQLFLLSVQIENRIFLVKVPAF